MYQRGGEGFHLSVPRALFPIIHPVTHTHQKCCMYRGKVSKSVKKKRKKKKMWSPRNCCTLQESVLLVKKTMSRNLARSFFWPRDKSLRRSGVFHVKAGFKMISLVAVQPPRWADLRDWGTELNSKQKHRNCAVMGYYCRDKEVEKRGVGGGSCRFHGKMQPCSHCELFSLKLFPDSVCPTNTETLWL